MPSIDAIIQYGDLSDIELKDEPNLLVQSLQISATREKQSWKGANLAIRAARYTNPLLTFAFTAIIGSMEGLANQHPGSEVTELMNYEGNIYDFNPDLGVMVFEDPVRTLSLENPGETTFNVVQHPFIGATSDTWIPTEIPD